MASLIVITNDTVLFEYSQSKIWDITTDAIISRMNKHSESPIIRTAKVAGGKEAWSCNGLHHHRAAVRFLKWSRHKVWSRRQWYP